MTNLVQFPGLGLEFEISRVAFSLFGLNVYWYGLLIGLGVILAILFVTKQAPAFGVDPDKMIDVILLGLVCGIVGARLYYVLFVSNIEYHSLWDVINLRDGGLGIYGGIILGFLGAFIGCKWRKVPILPLFDLVAMGFLIGQCIGRWGNFFNQEAFGTNTSLPWGMISPATTAYLASQQDFLMQQGIAADPFLPVHPTFLYESLWCALGFLLLFLYRKHRRFNGEIALFYAIWYGTGRFFIEGLRTDSLLFMGLRVSQIVAAVSVLAALGIWVAVRLRVGKTPLHIPEISPRSMTVRVKTDTGVERVEITWPANEAMPDKEARLAMAKAILQKEQEEAAQAESRSEAEAKDCGEQGETEPANEPGKAEEETDVQDKEQEG